MMSMFIAGATVDMPKYTRAQLIDCLTAEYHYICLDSPPDGDELTEEEYVEDLHDCTYSELVEETTKTGEDTLDEYVSLWS